MRTTKTVTERTAAGRAGCQSFIYFMHSNNNKATATYNKNQAGFNNVKKVLYPYVV